MRMRPIEYWWSSEFVMVPSRRFAFLAKKQFTVGEHYRLDVSEERSDSSHRHYFACVHRVWENLPPKKAEEFKTDDHLRRWALIECGYYQEKEIDYSSQQDAIKTARYMRDEDDRNPEVLYSEIKVRGNVVRRRIALSQSYRSMKKELFERSKADVLALLAETIGVSTEELKNAGNDHDSGQVRSPER